MFRRTKIVATLGPASSSPESLSRLITAGTNVFRLNLSHQQPQCRQLVEHIRQQAIKHQQHTAILADLQGPKIRIGRFSNNSVTLKQGDSFVLDARLPDDAGNEQGVSVSFPALADDCKEGDTLLLDDGRMSLAVETIVGSALTCRVLNDGVLSNHQGLNRLGGGLSAPALTSKDHADIKLAAELGVDFLAVSFPRHADDIHEATRLFREAGGQGGVIAKIERAEAVASQKILDDIITASDGVMVARGDLAVEIGDAELIAVQKQLIRRSRELGRFVITATQMMETMIHNTKPTRAEVSDVANAVLDGTDAVMLSAETAVGEHPAACVDTMDALIRGAERSHLAGPSPQMPLTPLKDIETAIATSAMFTAYRLQGVAALVALTDTGQTPLMMSRLRSGMPIFALADNRQTLRRMAPVRGIMPLYLEKQAKGKLEQSVIGCLKKQGVFQTGDRLIFTHGKRDAGAGSTNSLKVITLP